MQNRMKEEKELMANNTMTSSNVNPGNFSTNIDDDINSALGDVLQVEMTEQSQQERIETKLLKNIVQQESKSNTDNTNEIQLLIHDSMSSGHNGLLLGGINSNGEDQEDVFEDGRRRNFILRISDTGGFHLQAVAAVTENIDKEKHDHGQNLPSNCLYCRKHLFKAWIMTIGSLFLVTAQILSLNWMIAEVTIPRCAMHTDCNMGQFCGSSISPSNITSMPRCWDCNVGWKKSAVSGKCKSNYEYYKNIRDDVTVWVSRKGIWHPKSVMNYTAVFCLQYLHCLQTDIGNEDDSRLNDDFSVSNDFMGAETEMWPYEGALWPYGDEYEPSLNCDYSKVSASKITWTNAVVLLFITLIFSMNIWEDIEECISEETLLDYKLKMTRQESSFHPLSPIHTLRFALRMRKFVLPWVISVAAALIVLTESINAKSILLNLVAVGFIVEADNIIVKFTLSEDEKRRITQVIKHAKQDTRNCSDLRQFQWPSVLVAAPTIMMVLTILRSEQIALVLGPLLRGCNWIFWILSYVFLQYFPLLLVGIEIIVAFLKTDRTSNKFIFFTIELCRTLNVIFLSWVFCEFAFMHAVSFHKINVFGFVLASVLFVINLLFNLGFEWSLYYHKVENQSNANESNNEGDLVGNEETAEFKPHDPGQPTEQVPDEDGQYSCGLLLGGIIYWCYVLLYVALQVIIWKYPGLAQKIYNTIGREYKVGLGEE